MDDPLITKGLPITMPLSSWKILGKYLVMLNRDHLDRGHSQTNLSNVMAGLAKLFVRYEAVSVQRGFNDIYLEIHKRALPRFFSADRLVAIANATGTEIFDLLRIDWRSTPRYRTEERRALLGAASRSKHFIGGSDRPSPQIRGRTLQLSPGFIVRKTQSDRPQSTRKTHARSRSRGLQLPDAKTLAKAVAAAKAQGSTQKDGNRVS